MFFPTKSDASSIHEYMDIRNILTVSVIIALVWLGSRMIHNGNIQPHHPKNLTTSSIENFHERVVQQTISGKDYSAIEDDIGDGNPISWSKRPNKEGKKTEKINPKFLVQGTPTPLSDRKVNIPNDMFVFSHHKCSPKCCPSPYSCSHGCVCQH